MRGRLKSLIAGASVLAGLVVAPAAFAAPAVDGEFAVPGGVGSNNELVQGPDGNMWVTRENDNGVARITPNGVVTPFPTTNTAHGITVGPDNNLWVTTATGVAKIDPATGAQLDAYDVGFAVAGAGITTGPDGNLWAVAGDRLVRFSAADPAGTDTPTTVAGMSGKGMDTGTDGLLWIADGSGRVISATAADIPVVTPYDTKINATGGVQDVAAGPAAQVAYASPQSDPQSVGRITPGGTPQITELGPSDPFGVVFGQDQAYWIARANTNDLLRLTPGGQTTTLTGFAPSGGVGPRKIATGPGNTLWVTLDTPDKVARVTGVEPPANNPANPAAPETTIDKAPKKKVKTSKKKAKVKFKFSSSAAAVTFECALDRKKKGKPNKPGTFAPCTSPKKYKLKPAKYTFKVRAVLAGVADATPAEQKLKVVFKKKRK